MKIQVADPNDPRLALGRARDEARERLAKLQESCGCCGGATCAVCVEAAGVAARIAVQYQDLYAGVVLTGSGEWWRLPIAEWAWQGDAAQKER